LYSKHSPRNAEFPVRTNLHLKTPVTSGVVALHLDFVAKPEGTRELNSLIGAVLKAGGLVKEGLETAVLLVSDREARLVTLLTFWDASRFANARERRITWMQKLLAPFADGPIRAQTSTPRFVLAEASADFGMENQSHGAHGAAELAPVAG
jgi:hypothetical protein